jgi:hypothetical protein
VAEATVEAVAVVDLAEAMAVEPEVADIEVAQADIEVAVHELAQAVQA